MFARPRLLMVVVSRVQPGTPLGSAPTVMNDTALIAAVRFLQTISTGIPLGSGTGVHSCCEAIAHVPSVIPATITKAFSLLIVEPSSLSLGDIVLPSAETA